ncbi:hypothetical protein [Undibacterium sp. Xuan67W]|uniref:hypothetical protein n=1 Tax=Undibacterium sp. Xuan67W TaxID=3413057 RepID=UPI003BEF74AB
MLIFIDTEFTDFANAELISIGLVSECGLHEFYAELPVNLSKCNDFVVTTVLPQLGKVAAAQCSVDELQRRLRLWLEQFSARAPIICFDYDGDWRLFCHAMSYEIPAWLRGKNIYKYLDQVALQMYFIDNRIKDHHALHDAKANCHAFNLEKAGADVIQGGK